MKLGLADSLAPRPPAILVLGEGALAAQIQNDLTELGLYSLSVQNLGLSVEDQELPRLGDPDAGLRMRKIFEAFRTLDERGQYDHAWVHPGLTVWGERAELEGWARQAGVSAISASTKNLQLFWNVHQTLELAKELGIPTLVLSDEPITSLREIEQTLNKLLREKQSALPLVLKSAYRVRGGFGNRVLRQSDDLKEWVPIWMNQIEAASGATLLFFERFLESARCYVQPFARLKSGEIEFFPVIDGSLMFEGRNWIEVCPAQNLDTVIRKKIESSSTKFLNAADFVGVGNLCFLSNGSEVYFTEGLARLNIGYRLWESVARTKAVQWQIAALAPALLPEVPKSKAKLQTPVCGINLKIYAEDTGLKIPCPGVAHELASASDFEFGAESIVTWDVVAGQNVDWKSNGALAQLTVFAEDWKHALKASRESLANLWISGGLQTNERFLLELLSHPWVEESMFYTGFVDEEFIPKQLPELEWLQTISSALNESLPPLSEGESYLWMNHRLPGPKTDLPWSERREFAYRDQKGVSGTLELEAGPVRICVFPVSEKRAMVRIQNWFFSIRRSQKGSPLQLMALASGRVHSVFFREEAKVPARQTVLVIESHQHLVSHRLPVEVKILKLCIKAEDEVEIGQTLAILERVTPI